MDSLCVQCNLPFKVPTPRRGRRPVCCSDQCRRERAKAKSRANHHYGPIPRRLCCWCLKYQVPPGGNHQRYCSKSCRSAANAHLHRNTAVDRCELPRCSRCGLVVPRKNPAHQPPKKYCDQCRRQVRQSVPGSQSNRARRLAYRNGERFSIYDLIERDGPACHLCGGDADPDLGRFDPFKASIDHLIPVTLGGQHTMANTKVAHLRCNISRGNRMLAHAA